MDPTLIHVYGFNKEYVISNLGIVSLVYLLFTLLFLISGKRKKVGVGLFLGLLCYHTALSMFMYHFGVADSIGYYNAGSYMTYEKTYWGNYDVGFMYSLLFMLIHYLKFTFLSCTLIFNLVGFSGLIFFYLALLDYFKMETGKGSYLRYFLLFPSLSIWTGFAGKDALSFLALGMVSYALINIKRRALYAIFALILLIHVRPYMFLIVTVSFLLAIIFSKGYSLLTKTVLLSVALGLIIAGHNIFMEKQGIDVANLQKTQEFIEGAQGVWGGGSDIDISKYNIVLKILSFLYRPFFFDVHNFMMLLSSIENLILLIVTLCLFRPSFYKTLFADKSLFGRFNLFFFIVGTILLASANANLGTIVRKKVMVTFSMLTLAAIYYNRFADKKEVEFPDSSVKIMASRPS
jgi:hypothetical protein